MSLKKMMQCHFLMNFNRGIYFKTFYIGNECHGIIFQCVYEAGQNRKEVTDIDENTTIYNITAL